MSYTHKLMYFVSQILSVFANILVKVWWSFDKIRKMSETKKCPTLKWPVGFCCGKNELVTGGGALISSVKSKDH